MIFSEKRVLMDYVCPGSFTFDENDSTLWKSGWSQTAMERASGGSSVVGCGVGIVNSSGAK